jgi:hypothetical protein
MPVTRVVHTKAVRFVRKMRGGTQAHLLKTDDGDFYVIKFLENPQGKRILVNEWLTSHIFRHLGIATPAISVVEISAEFLKASPQVYIQSPHGKLSVAPGSHFGSRFPGDPDRLAVYDLLPSALLGKVANRSHFLGAFMLDRWMANTDSRQAIFHHTTQGSLTVPETSSRPPGSYLAEMVDFSRMFDGQHWEFIEYAAQGVYRDVKVYSGFSATDLEQWTEAMSSFPAPLIWETAAAIPTEWRETDGDPLERLLDKLLKRRGRVADIAWSTMRSAMTHPSGRPAC